MNTSRVPNFLKLGLLPLSLTLLSGCVDDESACEPDATHTCVSAAGGSDTGTGGGDGTGGTTGTGATTGTGGSVEPASGRVVGYLATWGSMDPSTLDFSTLTHICIAFAAPTGNGNEVTFGDSPSTPGKIAAVVEAAHQHGVKVLGSLAGANQSDQTREKLGSDNVDAFVTSMVDFMNEYQFDGLDIDIEGHAVDFTYAPFVKKLAAAIGEDKLLTAAVATWNGDDFEDDALAEYDFINLMSYDHCGTWTDACEHSTPANMQNELAYWHEDRGIPKDRIVIGLPFYGYCWGASCPGGSAVAVTHSTIVSMWPSQASDDWFSGDGYQVSHNGPATIASKLEVAKDYGGSMIWELSQDGTGEDSLFQVVADAQ